MAIGLISAMYLLMYILRSALIVYLPSYLHETCDNSRVSMIALIIFPLAGSAGMVLVGWLSDRLNTAGRIMIVIVLTPILAILFPLFPALYGSYRLAGVFILGMASALLYGLESQLSSTVPVAIVGQEYSSLAAGIIDSSGSIGGALSGYISGLIIDLYGFPQMLALWCCLLLLQVPLSLILLSLIKRDRLTNEANFHQGQQDTWGETTG